MSNIRTDLAVETREEIAKKGEIGDGVLFNEKIINGFLCSKIEITNKTGEKITGRSIGKYITIELGRIWLKEYSAFLRAVELTAKKIKTLMGSDYKKILIVGLGNNYITADSIGPKVLRKIMITRHLKQQIPGVYENMGLVEMSGISPGVLGQTGMETAEIILSVAKEIDPTLVIIIDALASRKVSRLATTIQLSDTGISPGSGVGNHRQAIDSKLLGVKVISIGVPTVVNAATLSYDILEEACKYLNIIPDDRITIEKLNAYLEETGGNFFVTPKESDVIINEVSKIIGYAVNRAFYKDISYEEMSRITN